MTLPDQPMAEPRGVLARLEPLPFALLALGVIFLLYQAVGGVITLLLFGTRVGEGNVQVLRWATLGGQVLFILVPTVLLARMRPPGPGTYFRWKVPRLAELLLALIAVFALQQLLQGYLTLQNAIPLPEPVRRFVEEFRRLLEETYRLLVTAHNPAEFLFVVLVAAVTPSICEELLFRGLVQRSLEEGMGGWPAALVTGTVFGAYHLSPFTVIPLIALGVFFGFLVYRTGNLALAVAAHFFNNFIACLAVYLQLEDDFLLLDPAGTPSGAVTALNYALFAVVLLVSLYAFMVLTRRPVETTGGGG